MDYCWNCGKDTDPNNRICPYCQADLQSQPQFNRCSHGHIVAEGALFCPWCGESVQSGPSKAPNVSPPAGQRNTRALDSPDSKAPRETIRLPSGGSPKTVILRPGETSSPKSGQAILTGFLVSYTLDRTGHFFPIREGRNTIGKGDNARLKINDPLLSEEHAVILYRNSQFIFEDRLSSNGSILNGEEAVGQINLKHGDVLKLGSNEFVLLVVPRITS